MSFELSVSFGDEALRKETLSAMKGKEGWLNQAHELYEKVRNAYHSAQKQLIPGDEKARMECEKLGNFVEEAHTLRTVVQNISSKLYKKDCKFLVAKTPDGRTEGIAVLSVKSERRLFVEYLATAPKNLDRGNPNRVSGVGPAIIREAVQVCPDLFCHEISLESAESARGFYVDKMGFQGVQENSLDLKLPVYSAFEKPSDYDSDEDSPSSSPYSDASSSSPSPSVASTASTSSYEGLSDSSDPE